MNIVHIGLGKTATSSFQHHVFPDLCRENDLLYNPLLPEIRRQVACNRLRIENPVFGELKAALRALPGFFISYESLHGWDPNQWQEFADRNREMFGADCRIILTIREPGPYLTAVYQQMVHQGHVMRPGEFFVRSSLYSPYYPTLTFDLERFSYQRLIDLYRERFTDVVVVPFEGLFDLTWLQAITGREIPDADRVRFGKALSGKRVNRSYSARAMGLTFLRETLLGKLGLCSISWERKTAMVSPRALEGPFDPERRDGVSGWIIRDSGPRGIRGWLHTLLSWRVWMQSGLDRVLPYRKFRVDFESLGFSLETLNDEYREVLAQERSRPADTKRVGSTQPAIHASP